MRITKSNPLFSTFILLYSTILIPHGRALDTVIEEISVEVSIVSNVNLAHSIFCSFECVKIKNPKSNRIRDFSPSFLAITSWAYSQAAPMMIRRMNNTTISAKPPPAPYPPP